MSLRQRAWLCLPPVLCCGCDVAATLLGQGPRYWSGDFRSAQEMNPVAGLLLAVHPAAFVGLALGWAAAVAVLLLAWRSPLAVAVGFAVTFGHAVGVALWLVTIGPLGYASAAFWLVAASRLTEFSWREAGGELRASHVRRASAMPEIGPSKVGQATKSAQPTDTMAG